MGKSISAYFAEAERLGGLEAKIKLAMLTRITSTRSAVEPDSPENLAKFEAAIAVVRAEMAPAPGLPPQVERRSRPSLAPGVRSLPGGEDLLWGVLSSLHDAMVAVFDRAGASMLSWESKSLGRRYGVGEGAASDAIARAIGSERAADIRAIVGGAEAREAEMAFSFGGTPSWLSVALSPIHDAEGKVAAIAAFVQDVTARKRSEELLRQSERRLREHNRVFLELVEHKSLFLGDALETNRRITEAAAKTLEVARASVWLYDEGKTKIVCADLYERAEDRHSAGIELAAGQFPAYFEALGKERTIAANDAHGDPRTSEFSAPYLAPLGITSMLDVPIRVGGKMAGVVCHEHVGPARAWTADEENFAYLMAGFVALSKELADGRV